ncbi:UNVERIFIED_CONTAM: hypothetical protein RMT77_005851 [Armadillidium vulgare]
MLSRLLLLGTLLGPILADVEYAKVECTPAGEIYEYSARLLDGSGTVSFEDYRGKVILIYNVATYCGITVTNYNQINALADYFEGEDLVILGFPSNEFHKLEPGSGMEIYNAVKYVNPGGGFEPKLTYFQKVNTNGAGASEIYTFLKSNCPFISDTFRDGTYYSPLQVGDVHWNFEKFLLGRDGRVYYRYNPTTYDAKDLIPDIEYLLSVNTTTTV